VDDRRPRKRRLFVGIRLDDDVRAACTAVAEELRRTGFAARYEAPEKLHVTIAFLGFVEPVRLEPLVAELARAATRAAAATVTFDRLGGFPHDRRPRIVFVGAREPDDRFHVLAGSVRRTFAALGFTFPGDIVAHVTIARVKEPRHALPPIEVPPLTLRMRELVLFESLADPVRKTSRYEILASAPLAPDDACVTAD